MEKRKDIRKEMAFRYKNDIKAAKKESRRNVRITFAISLAIIALILAAISGLCIYRLVMDKTSILVEFGVLITSYTYYVIKPYPPFAISIISAALGAVAFILSLTVKTKKPSVYFARVISILSTALGTGTGVTVYLLAFNNLI